MIQVDEIYLKKNRGRGRTIINITGKNKSWKPECVLSFNMCWQILLFYSGPEARDKISNICQPMLKLKTHSGHVKTQKTFWSC